MSYTEKEFHYATSKGIPVLAFIRNDLEKLPADQTEKKPGKQKKLEAFIGKLKTDATVDFWSNPDELATKSLAALSQESISHEGVGWIRANKAAGADILGEINELRKSNTDLSAKLASNKPSPIFDDLSLAELDEKFEFVVGTQQRVRGAMQRQAVSLTWRAILAAIGSSYRTAANINGMSGCLDKPIQVELQLGANTGIYIDTDDKNRILMQMEALGMMRADTRTYNNGVSDVVHKLTDNGLACMLRANVVRSTKETGSN